MQKIQKNFIIIAVIGSLFTSAFFLNKNSNKPKLVTSKQTTALNFNTQLLQFFSLGQSRVIADLLWISTLLESDLEHYKKRDLNSWIYLRFNSISILDPKFLRLYLFGGKYLSIIKDDLYGAEKLLRKGLRIYPHNFDLNFDIAYLYTYELDDFEKGLLHYKKIQNHERAPHYLKTTIAKLEYHSSGDIYLAEQLIQDLYKRESSDSPFKQKLHHDLYTIRATIDLDCLNNNLGNCRSKDLNGDYYFKKDGVFRSVTPFTEYKVYKRPGRE